MMRSISRGRGSSGVLQVAKFTLLVLVVIFLLFAAERLLVPVVAPLV